MLIAGLRSLRGASNRILQLIGSGRFEIALSVAVILEYEEAAKRHSQELVYSDDELERILGYLCEVAEPTPIHFLWRGYGSDPADAMIPELAVAAGCDTIVTFNRRHFTHAREFGLAVLTPRESLEEVGELP